MIKQNMDTTRASSISNELLTLQILERETGLSNAEIEILIQNLERISETLTKYTLPQIPKHKNFNNDIFSNLLLRLRLAAVSILYRNRNFQSRKKRRNSSQTNKGNGSKLQKISKGITNESRYGITTSRLATAQKWSNLFDSNATKLTIVQGKGSSPASLKETTDVVLTNNISSKHCYNSNCCYICRENIDSQSKLHPFYPKMCVKCGDFNFEQRNRTANLQGKIALVTGGRIKIGYETVLKLLRCGAMVILTTRFPADAAKRYCHESDFHTWKDRIHIYPLDLRFLKDVEMFCDHLTHTYNKLDILIQNAAQTVRKPVAFYEHLLHHEASSQDSKCSALIHSWDQCEPQQIKNSPRGLNILDLTKPNNSLQRVQSEISPTGVTLTAANIAKSALSSQLIVHPEDVKSCQNLEHFPVNCYDEDHQQLDLRPVNSWVLEAHKVDTSELVEVNLINSISPFVILKKLTPILKNSRTVGGFGWIILVSAMEGKFNRFKTSQHPHTNCAKASLNMLVRTSASYYRKYGLLLNAVDTGWVTDEEPVPLKCKRKTFFQPPIDCVDGASRILNPIFQTIDNDVLDYGVFFKDYKPTSW